MKAIVNVMCSDCLRKLPSINCKTCMGEVHYKKVMDVEPVEPVNKKPNLNQMFDAFNAQYGIETKPLDHNLDGMVQIVGGEFDEWTEEITEPLFGSRGFIPEPENFVKEGLDVIYAMTQQLRERGVDIDAGLSEVHRSNMSKVVEDGSLEGEIATAKNRYPDVIAQPISEGRYVLKSPSQGKVIKPACYSSAVITEAIIKQK